MDKKQKFSVFFKRKFLDWQIERGDTSTWEEFAEHLGISRQDASRYKLAQNIPDGDNVYKIAAKLGDEIYEILGIAPLVKDPRLRQINKLWELLSEEIREALFDTAQRGKAITALRERREGESDGRKTKKTK